MQLDLKRETIPDISNIYPIRHCPVTVLTMNNVFLQIKNASPSNYSGRADQNQAKKCQVIILLQRNELDMVFEKADMNRAGKG